MKLSLSLRHSFLILGILIFATEILAAEKRPLIYRMSQLEEAKKRANAEGKPIAWIGTATKYLSPYTKDIQRQELTRRHSLCHSSAVSRNHPHL